MLKQASDSGRRSLLAHFALGTAGCLALLSTAVMLPASTRAAGPDLPEGAMKAKAVTLCMECHDAHIIVQQRMNQGAWVKEVEKMTRWGATVAPEDKDALVEYLSSNFKVETPAYEAAQTAGAATHADAKTGKHQAMAVKK